MEKANSTVKMLIEVPANIHYAIAAKVVAEKSNGNKGATVKAAYIQALENSISK